MGIFDKLSRRTPDPVALEALRERIVLWVQPGFNTRSDVLEYAGQFRDDDELRVTDRQLKRLVDDVWQARLAEQRTWPDQTDADKVAAAFADLDDAGVVARMDFTCCQTCGVAEIDDERPTDRPSVGYVFFHQQDTERLADPAARLYLAYGAFDPIPGQVAEQDTEIGRRIESALRARHLPVDWSGSSGQRISVGPISWQRRLPV